MNAACLASGCIITNAVKCAACSLTPGVPTDGLPNEARYVLQTLDRINELAGYIKDNAEGKTIPFGYTRENSLEEMETLMCEIGMYNVPEAYKALPGGWWV